ncbi:MAG: bifunctional hydroxymethylpyrimidine kinase/phosphomethylpyrimidine kinase [Hydrogenothermaceae bacterium]|nr:bifunctional hydroxymethylpyrimidine kinase/phosphomethylpyrimidine kinase [Hydrogenothermaceae bacterium]
MKVALTVAGSDPSGGAGIQADIRVFTTFGIYSMSVITALTVQNTLGVKESIPVSYDLFKKQLETVLEDIIPDVLKVGMIQTAENVEILAESIEKYNLKLNVIDTVIKSKNGTFLLEPKGVESFIKKIIPLTYVLTPNTDEAEYLTGKDIKSYEDIKKACVDLHKIGARYVIIKGGHFESGDEVIDTLYDGKDFYTLKSKRINTKNTHGTGCTFASALASSLAKGKDIYTAFNITKAYMIGSLSNQVDLGKGVGPVNHLWLSGM